MGTKPFLNVSFSFFQAKGGHAGKKIFGLYQNSNKDFKDRYFKVKSPDAKFLYFLNEYGLTKFPLYQSFEVGKILEVKYLSLYPKKEL